MLKAYSERQSSARDNGFVFIDTISGKMVNETTKRRECWHWAVTGRESLISGSHGKKLCVVRVIRWRGTRE